MDNEMNSLDQQLDWKAVELVGNPPTIPLGHGQARNADSKSTSRASFMNNSGKMIMGKRCQYPGGCDRRAQTFQRCKRHGGGARCIVEGCNRCSQGRKKCRAHGGGSPCKIPGCLTSAQRDGLCFQHGGRRICVMEGCNRQQRSNGKCSAHGPLKLCSRLSCTKKVRKEGLCMEHYRTRELSSPDLLQLLSDNIDNSWIGI